MNNIEEIINEFNRIIKEEKLTILGIAERGGTSTANISRILRRQVENPSLELLTKIAKGMNYDLKINITLERGEE